MDTDSPDTSLAEIVKLLKELKKEVAEIRMLLKSEQAAKMRQSSYKS